MSVSWRRPEKIYIIVIDDDATRQYSLLISYVGEYNLYNHNTCKLKLKKLEGYSYPFFKILHLLSVDLK